MNTFTLLCPCGACNRGLSILQAMAYLSRHRDGQLIPDHTYDRLLEDVLAAAESALA